MKAQLLLVIVVLSISITGTGCTSNVLHPQSSSEIRHISVDKSQQKVVFVNNPNKIAENSPKNTPLPQTENLSRSYPFCVIISPGEGLSGNGKFTNSEAYAAGYFNNLPKDGNGNPIVKAGQKFCINKPGFPPVLTIDAGG